MTENTDFLFINKFSTSQLSNRNDARATTVIQRFVQKGRRRTQRPKLVSSFRARAFEKPLSTQKSSNESNELIINNESRVFKASQLRLNLPSNSSDTKSETSYDHTVTQFRSRAPLQPYGLLNSGIDPFDATPVPMDGDAWMLFQYYNTVIDPFLWLWPTEMATRSKDAAALQKAGNPVIQNALSDDLAMYCLLAISITRLQYADDLLCLNTPSKENEYIGKALKLMQDRINEEVLSPESDPRHLFGHMLFLSGAEAFRGNPLAARTHFKAGLDLLAFHGMTMADVAQDNLQGIMVILDQFFGCLNLQQCLYPYEIVTLSELSLQWNEIQASISDLEPMALSFSTYPFVSSELSALITQITETYRIKRSLKESLMSASRSKEASLWVRARYRAIRSGLLSTFTTPHSQVSASSIESLRSLELVEIAVRIALVLFTFLLAKMPKSVTFGEPLGQQLRRFVSSLLNRPYLYSSSMPHGMSWGPLVLWILIVGYTCAADRGETEAWFEQRCSELINTSAVLSRARSLDHDDLLRRLEQSQTVHFYHISVQRTYLERLVEKQMTSHQAGVAQTGWL